MLNIESINNKISFLFHKSPYAKVFKLIKVLAEEKNAEVYLVGGAVRDIVLLPEGQLPADLDFVVFGFPYDIFAVILSRRLKKNAVPFKDNIRIPFNDNYIDISAPRGEKIQDDLRLRDFTINNMAVTLDEKILGNPDDIISGIIKPVHKNIFIDDPLRIIRGFRQATKFNFKLSNEFITLVQKDRYLLSNVAQERVNDELKKISDSFSKKTAVDMLNYGIWIEILGVNPNPDKLDAAMNCCTTDNEIRYALMLSTILLNKPQNLEKIAKKLHISNKIYNLMHIFLNAINFTAAATDEKKRYIWENKSNISVIVKWLRSIDIIDEINETEYLKLIAMMNASKAKLITGNDIIELAPEKGQGKWIANLLTDTKIKLAFGEIDSRQEALESIQKHLNNYIE